jgi:hypothetical protein
VEYQYKISVDISASPSQNIVEMAKEIKNNDVDTSLVLEMEIILS